MLSLLGCNDLYDDYYVEVQWPGASQLLGHSCLLHFLDAPASLAFKLSVSESRSAAQKIQKLSESPGTAHMAALL